MISQHMYSLVNTCLYRLPTLYYHLSIVNNNIIGYNNILLIICFCYCILSLVAIANILVVVVVVVIIVLIVLITMSLVY